MNPVPPSPADRHVELVLAGRQISIQPFRAEDLEPVEDILRQTGNFKEVELHLAREMLETVLSEPDRTSYLAYVAVQVDSSPQQVRGYVMFGPTPATAGTWDLYWIAVAPSWYGTGVARALDEYVTDYVQQTGGYWVIVQTSSQPTYARPRAFYSRQGYRVLAAIDDYYSPGDNLIIYGKRLPSQSARFGTTFPR
ncbi:MAG: N-acetyltransferase [Pirellulales bacterium]